MNKTMCALSNWLAKVLGHPAAFSIATILLLATVAIGAVLKFSDAYMLALTLLLSILAILLLFPIQYSTNRDTIEMKAKIDELIRALPGAKPPAIDDE